MGGHVACMRVHRRLRRLVELLGSGSTPRMLHSLRIVLIPLVPSIVISTVQAVVTVRCERVAVWDGWQGRVQLGS